MPTKKKKTTSSNWFSKFKAEHPVLTNAILAIVVIIAGLYALLLLIDIFTLHGREVKVPNVTYMNINEAKQKLDEVGLDYEIDSTTFNEDYRPGIVIAQSPAGACMVKPTRTVYLTVNRFSPPTQMIPRDLTNMPGSNGISKLKSLGFTNIDTDTLPSDKNGLIIGISVNGHNVAAGSRAPLNARITLTIGDGSMDIQEYNPLPAQQRDSLVRDLLRRGRIRIEENPTDGSLQLVDV